MRPVNRFATLITVIIGTLATAPGLHAQRPPSAVVARVEAAVDRGEFEVGVRLIQAALEPRGALRLRPSDRAWLTFTLGWVRDRWADSIAETTDEAQVRRSELREGAVGSYRDALEMNPGHDGATVHLALALEKLGRIDDAAKALAEPRADGKPRGWRAKITLADLHLRRGRPHESLEVLETIDDATRSGSVVLGRRLRALRALPDTAFDAARRRDLLTVAEGLDRTGHPGQALDGFEELLRRPASEIDRNTDDEVALRWADLRTRSGGVEIADFDRIAPTAGAPSRALAELAVVVREATVGAERTAWWREGDERRHVFSQVLRQTARRAEAAGNLAGGTALVMESVRVAPSVTAYRTERLADREPAKLCAVRDLASLLVRQGTRLGEDGARALALIDSLDPAEGDTHPASDLRGIGAYHEALAIVNLRRGNAAGAERHVEATLAAERSDAESAGLAPRPLPHLSELAAEAADARRDPVRAADARLAAMRQYLELEDDRAAARVAKAVKPTNELQRQQLAELGTMTERLQGIKTAPTRERENLRKDLENELLKAPDAGSALDTTSRTRVLLGILEGARIEAEQSGGTRRAEELRAKQRQLREKFGLGDKERQTPESWRRPKLGGDPPHR